MSQFWYGQEFFLAVMADTSSAIGKVGAESWIEREGARQERDERLGNSTWESSVPPKSGSVSLRNEVGQTRGQK